MPYFWEHSGANKDNGQKHHNLQEGLFQIASQTCSLFVQINNTNNISYGDNTANIHLNGEKVFSSSSSSSGPSSASSSGYSSNSDYGKNCSKNRNNGKINVEASDEEQLVVLIPPSSPHDKRRMSHHFNRSGIFKKPRLSTVPEAPLPHENDLWPQTYAVTNHDGSPTDRWSNNNKWCRPSCIPITIICTLIFLVVLLPVLDHATEKALQQLNQYENNSCNSCSLSLVESIPEGLVYNESTSIIPLYPSTFNTWIYLINNAQESIDIASMYWTLRQSEIYPDPSSIKGEQVFQSILKAGTDRGVKIRIAQNLPSRNYPNVDTEFLVKRKAADVRSLNFPKLLGGGVLHTKFWIIDKKHVYIGSANMDWRALTQVKELGIAIYNCTTLAYDISKIFEVYWSLGENNSVIPVHWPNNLSTKFNMDTPFNLVYENKTFQTYISSSPPEFNPTGRTNDIDALTNVIEHAEKFVYIAVMDYMPLMIYTAKRIYWPIIDNALKTAAIQSNVKVKLLISKWNHSRLAEDNFLKSLADISDSYPGVSIEIRRFIVPADKDQSKIPYARVNHNKYMVTDNSAYIGTSNWSGDYFTDTAGVSFVLHDPIFDRNSSHSTIRSELQGVFERDWNSEYAHALI